MLLPPKPKFKERNKVVFTAKDGQTYNGVVLSTTLSSSTGAYTYLVQLDRAIEGTEIDRVIVKDSKQLTVYKAEKKNKDIE